MNMTPQIAAARITRELTAAETLLDQAGAAIASLTNTAMLARAQTDAPFGIGQAALLRLSKAQQQLVGAQGDVQRAHSELLKTAITMIPDHDGDCPKDALTLADDREAA